MKKFLSTVITIYILLRFICVFLSVLCQTLTISFPVSNMVSLLGNKQYLILLQSALGIMAIIIPKILEKRYKLIIPVYLYLLFAIFLYGSIFLGEVEQFYIRFSWWDILFHFMSGILIGIISLSLFLSYNLKNKNHATLGSLFVFFCSVSLGVIWEIYEFIIDGLYGVNMQKFIDINGNNLVGRIALVDTMHDLIADCYGALLIAIISYIVVKYNKKWLQPFIIQQVKNNMEK